MEKRKYVVELEIPDEVMKTFSLTSLNLDEVVKGRIVNGLLAVTKGLGKVLVYDFEKGPAAVDLYKDCPVCGHPWANHFQFLDADGKLLADPLPAACPGTRGIKCSCTANDVLQMPSKKVEPEGV